MKMAVFWNGASCSLVNNNRRFSGAYCLRHQAPNDEGSKTPLKRLPAPDYTVQHPRRQPSSINNIFISISDPELLFLFLTSVVKNNEKWLR
jgi:hypothetical protein